MRFPASRLLTHSVPALFLALAACTDRNPAAAPRVQEPVPPPEALALLACTVSIPAGTMACAAPASDAPGGASAVIIGGQGINVRLTSTGMAYDAATSIFRMDVAVENLMAQALGTADGITPSADGVRVFFHTGPISSGGGALPVWVANADGEAYFLTAGQKYFQYGGILAPGDTTPAREWRFNVPAAVTSFSFGVYVAAPVRAEPGWISMSPLAPAVLVGDTVRVTAAVRTVAGGEADGAVAWTTSSPGVATVDAQGVVTGIAAGTATIAATGGGRTGSVEVRVYTAAGTAYPGIRQLQVPDGSVAVEWGRADSVTFRVEYGHTGAQPDSLRVTLRHPNGVELACMAATTSRTTPLSELRCGLQFPYGSLGGVWKIERVQLAGRTVSHAALLAAGAPAHVYVHSPDADLAPPELISFNIAPTSVQAGVDVVWLEFMAADQGTSGFHHAGAFLTSPDNPSFGCGAGPFDVGPPGVFYRCGTLLPAFYRSGTYQVDSVWVQDRNRNRRTYRPAELQAAGFPVQLTITSTNPDTVPPTITAFSFSPLTVEGTGPDTVTVTLTATEPTTASGVWFLDMEFQKLSDETQRRRCLLNGSGRVYTRTMTCKLVFGPGDAGNWWVRYVRAIDFLNQSRELQYAEVRAAGWPVDLYVRGPNPDTIPPRIAAFSFSPQTVAGNGADSVSVTFTATEPAAETGVWFMDVVFEKVSNTVLTRRCLVNGTGPVASRTLACRQAFAPGDAGEWRVRYIRAIDFMNNARLLRTADLQAAGYSTQLTITP